MYSVLVVGASGVLGTEVVRLLREERWPLRMVWREGRARPGSQLAGEEVVAADLTDASSLRGICDQVETVFSCAGASMSLGALRDRTSFAAVDWRGNLRLLDEAKRAGVRRFVYVSVFGGERMRHTRYADAHERFADALRASGLDYGIVRPTGFFSFFGDVLRMASKGRGLVLGSGEARTNPVHEHDVAAVCIAAIRAGGGELPVGGPQTLTRRGIVELAFDVVGHRATLRRLPPSILKAAAVPLAFVNPRLHALMHFGIEVSQVDCVAPVVGRSTLRDYFARLAGVNAPLTGDPVPAA